MQPQAAAPRAPTPAPIAATAALPPLKLQNMRINWVDQVAHLYMPPAPVEEAAPLPEEVPDKAAEWREKGIVFTPTETTASGRLPQTAGGEVRIGVFCVSHSRQV